RRVVLSGGGGLLAGPVRGDLYGPVFRGGRVLRVRPQARRVGRRSRSARDHAGLGRGGRGGRGPMVPLGAAPEVGLSGSARGHSPVRSVLYEGSKGSAPCGEPGRPH